MSITKINLILIILLNASVLFLFINYVKVRNDISFDAKRIDELEKRPLLSTQTDFFPEAGESGKITNTATPIPNLAIPTSIPKTSPSPTTTPKSTANPSIVGTRITYLPIFGGGAQTTDTNWVDVPGSDFQLKASDYGSSSYFTWDAIAFLVGGSGEARLQIYDLTNHVAVTGSQISVTAPRSTLVSSGKLTFFSGNNLYRIQISSLTSSTAQFDFGRIKVVY